MPWAILLARPNVRHIGASNFMVERLATLLEGPTLVPVVRGRAPLILRAATDPEVRRDRLRPYSGRACRPRSPYRRQGGDADGGVAECRIRGSCRTEEIGVGHDRLAVAGSQLLGTLADELDADRESTVDLLKRPQRGQVYDDAVRCMTTLAMQSAKPRPYDAHPSRPARSWVAPLCPVIWIGPIRAIRAREGPWPCGGACLIVAAGRYLHHYLCRRGEHEPQVRAVYDALVMARCR